METTNPSKPIRNLLVLVAVCGLVLAGWLAGHILRHITPANQHPPSREIDPRIKTGLFLESGDRITLDPKLIEPQIRIYTNEKPFNSLAGCADNLYFTSLPAKCFTSDRQLVQVGGSGPNVIILPQGK